MSGRAVGGGLSLDVATMQERLRGDSLDAWCQCGYRARDHREGTSACWRFRYSQGFNRGRYEAAQAAAKAEKDRARKLRKSRREAERPERGSLDAERSV